MAKIGIVLYSLVILGISALSGCSSSPKTLPGAESEALSRLTLSPRHGEWVTVDAGNGDKVESWIVYPERKDKAPVVLVIHEIFGLSDWVREVSDQIASEGFIAIAPDLLSGKAPGGKGSRDISADTARELISKLDADETVRRLDAVSDFAMKLPAALPRFACIGFCWGGGTSFMYATKRQDLAAAIVFYGPSPATKALSKIQSPVLGLYGGDDARVDETIPPADAEMKKLGKQFEYTLFPGAGHAFLRQQGGRNGANLSAARAAWPKAISFLREKLGS
jgi:carboxymethylenebutenolidase